MVGLGGLEPPTSPLSGVLSIYFMKKQNQQLRQDETTFGHLVD
jgi:hypothetical protein